MILQILFFSFMAAADCLLPATQIIHGPALQQPPAKSALFRHGYSNDFKYQEGQSLQLLSWNIYKTGKKQFWSEAKSLVPNYDFVLLQENQFTEDSLQNQCRYFPQEFVSAISFWQTNGWGTGVSTGSLLPSTDEKFLRSSWREPFLNTPKLSVITKYQLGKKNLLIVNVHGINFVFDKGLEDQLKAIAKKISAHDGPLIVAGDFNTHTAGRRRALANFAKSLGLKHIALENDNRSRRLDHILVRKVTVERAELLNAHKGSDHKPLSLQFHM